MRAIVHWVISVLQSAGAEHVGRETKTKKHKKETIRYERPNTTVGQAIKRNDNSIVRESSRA